MNKRKLTCHCSGRVRASTSWLQAVLMLGNSAFMLDVLNADATAFLQSMHGDTQYLDTQAWGLASALHALQGLPAAADTCMPP